MIKNLLTKSLFFLGALALVFTATASASAATLSDGVTFSDSNAWQISFPSVTISNAMEGESLDCSPWSSRVSGWSFQGVCTFKYNPNRTENVDLSVDYRYQGPISSSGGYPNWWMAEYWYTDSAWIANNYQGNNYSLNRSPRASLSVPSGTVSISRPVNGQAAGHTRTHWDFSFHNQFGGSDNRQLIKIWAEPNTDIPLNSTTINNTNLWLAHNGSEFIPLPNNSAPVNWPVIGEASVVSNQTPTCQVKYQNVSQDSFSPTSGDYNNRYAFFNLKATGSHSYDLDCDGAPTLSPAYTATGLPISTDIRVAVRGNEPNSPVSLNVGGSLTTAATQNIRGNGVANFQRTNWDIYNVFVPEGYKLAGDPTSYAQIAGFHCAAAGRDACWAVLAKWMGPNNADQWVDTFLETDQADDLWVIQKITIPNVSIDSLSLSKVGTSATSQTLAVCPSQSFTVSWEGGNLPASCSTASNPALTGWNGNSVSSNSTAGTYSLSTPSSSGDYHLGLICGDDIGAQIRPLSSDRLSPQLTVLPSSHPSCFTLTATDSTNPISGLVTDGSGNAISGVTVSVNNGAWTAVSGSNGAWSIPASTHNLVKGGSFSVSAVLPAGYQSAVAKNARTSASSYQWQILDVDCADTTASPSCRDLVGTWLKDASLLDQTVLNGQIHDLAQDNTYDFVLNREPALSASCSALPTIVDINTPATLTASISGGSGNYTYDWSYSPDPGTESINVSYNTAGTKAETVTVRDVTRNLATTASCILNVSDPSTPPPATPVILPACSDGLDNDADGKIDSADPGCLVGGTFYNANDNDETDPSVIPGNIPGNNPGDNPGDNPDGTSNTPEINLNQSYPSVTLAADPSSFNLSEIKSTTLTWSVTDATSCTAGGDPAWKGHKNPTGGSESVSVTSAGSHQFTLTCSNNSGNSGYISIYVNASQPSLQTSCTPTGANIKNILKGAKIDLTQFFNCSVTELNYSVSGQNIIDNKYFSPAVTGDYVIEVTKDGYENSVQKTIRVNVFAPDVEEVN